MVLDLGEARGIDQRPDHRPLFRAGADLQCLDRIGELLGEYIMDLVLHQDAIGADAGLAGIAIFAERSRL